MGIDQDKKQKILHIYIRKVICNFLKFAISIKTREIQHPLPLEVPERMEEGIKEKTLGAHEGNSEDAGCKIKD